MGNYLISHKEGDNNIVIYENITQNDIKPISVSFDYDLYQAHNNSPVTDIETIPFIPTRWISKPNQIPFTFPINKILKEENDSLENYCPNFIKFGECTIKGCGLIHAKLFKKFRNVKFCYSFAKNGICDKIEVKFLFK